MFRRMICWIKKIFFRKKYKLLETLKFGDEFWANVKAYEGQILPEGHRKRPFVFIELKDNKIFCLYESSRSGRNSIPIIRAKRTAFVYYDKLYQLDAECFMNEKKGSLTSDELTEIVRNGFTKTPMNQFFSKFQEYATIKVGDIVRHNNMNYYLSALDSVLATIYPIRNTYSDWFVRTSNHKYIAIFSPLQVKKETLSLIRPENPKLVQVIKENKNKAKREKKNMKINKAKRC